MPDMELMKVPGYVNPELAEILARSPPAQPVSETADIYAVRERHGKAKEAAKAASGNVDSSIMETDHRIPTQDGSEITVRVYAGPQSHGGPVLVMLHGGGFCLGDLDDEAFQCRQWCKDFNGISINVDYRLAPEFVFPTAALDAYDAVRWTAANPEIHGGALSKGFVVAGVSAGANMACTLSHLARDDDLKPKLTGIFLSIPALLSPSAVPEKWKGQYSSREENKDALILGQGAIKLFRRYYKDDPDSPLMSPAIFPSHENLPPTYFQVAGADPLRDDAFIYEKMLREEAGVPTKMDIYPGLPHGFWFYWPEADFSKKWQRDTTEGFRWLLAKH